MKMIAPVLCLALLGCSQRDAPANESAIDTSSHGSTPLKPGVRPVMIGEGGAGLDACVARGRVVNLSPGEQPYLAVRAAPFAEAREVARLQNGAPMFVCTRSIDQAWRGVVIPPLDHPDADCGVTAPVATNQPYSGPCTSGWVASGFVELSAG
jgi:hypothetical protein